MKRTSFLFSLTISCLLLINFSACKKDDPVGDVTAGIFRSIAAKKVAFTALTLNATEWQWDFGDGETSTEKDPVHVYAAGGIYDIKLIAKRGSETAEATSQVQLDLSVLEMLTGGAAASNGKTWKISAGHSEQDAITLANEEFTSIQDIPAGALGLFLGLGEEYEDEFTFKADGSYSHDNKNGGSFGGLVFAVVTQKEIVKITGESQSFGFATLAFAPESGATFTYTEEKDLAVTVVSQEDGETTADIVYPGVSTLSFSGSEFIGFMGFHREVIIQEISPEKMRLVMFMSATQGAHFDKPSLAIIFTFEVVQ